jgi:TctA family transporter
MIGAEGSVSVFWSNGLVGSIMMLAVILLFWPLIEKLWSHSARRWKQPEHN